MKYLSLMASLLFLTGCVGDRSDLELFVTTTKAQHVAKIPPLPKPPVFEHFVYQAELLRSPFVPPSRELSDESVDLTKNCTQPDLKRRKGRLETYALDNLTMRGTLKRDKNIWALIQTNEGNVFRLGVGEYLGLYHGRITKITPLNVEVIELIPDGSGCWAERPSTLELAGE
ncbi:pilus assembly protein PilP [Shewanella sp. JM162201]|uniref:Pilus assembly protein PilP n=1 Tax=Shewanella jiangmenensis TaxID=2837387 RepID=A0ABS5V4C7_9GAMM|nr:pilus assembly protein PilP [Shewanella jiangmenensis]MBT1445319.1 pilus assembly protein PilP [Shewanella jiangmenensis]